MIDSRLHNNVRKISALLAAILILPTLALAGNGQGGNGQGQNGNGQGSMWAPEANTGIVLIPFVGAVMVFSAVQFLRARAAQKKGY
jgi:hypothetical protein